MIKELLRLFPLKYPSKMIISLKKENQTDKTNYIHNDKNRNTNSEALMFCFMPETPHTNVNTDTSS